ncbi:hypothetical protein BLNAU_13219 [Blattamonas nauphoetae]|uniref:Rab-GAP TBC domain-containing protein n=1 Tax=Blattamonas nauphoetae TaxID=2049346 RepID=A0ABQ9XM12_9EUKA|nr:hypothetical protein BLNAU_13219 [Blattamonas nauphoetae]
MDLRARIIDWDACFSQENSAISIDIPFNQERAELYATISKTQLLRADPGFPGLTSSCETTSTHSRHSSSSSSGAKLRGMSDTAFPIVQQLSFIPNPPIFSFFCPSPFDQPSSTPPTNSLMTPQLPKHTSMPVDSQSFFVAVLYSDGVIRIVCLPLFAVVYTLSLPTQHILGFALSRTQPTNSKNSGDDFVKNQTSTIDVQTVIVLDCVDIGTGKRQRMKVNLYDWLTDIDTKRHDKGVKGTETLRTTSSDSLAPSSVSNPVVLLEHSFVGCCWYLHNEPVNHALHKGHDTVTGEINLATERDLPHFSAFFPNHIESETGQKKETHPTDLMNRALASQLSRSQSSMSSADEHLHRLTDRIVFIHFLVLGSAKTLSKTQLGLKNLNARREERNRRKQALKASQKSPQQKREMSLDEVRMAELQDFLDSSEEAVYSNMYPYRIDKNVVPLLDVSLDFAVGEAFESRDAVLTNDRIQLCSPHFSFGISDPRYDVPIPFAESKPTPTPIRSPHFFNSSASSQFNPTSSQSSQPLTTQSQTSNRSNGSNRDTSNGIQRTVRFSSAESDQPERLGRESTLSDNSHHSIHSQHSIHSSSLNKQEQSVHSSDRSAHKSEGGSHHSAKHSQSSSHRTSHHSDHPAPPTHRSEKGSLHSDRGSIHSSSKQRTGPDPLTPPAISRSSRSSSIFSNRSSASSQNIPFNHQRFFETCLNYLRRNTSFPLSTRPSIYSTLLSLPMDPSSFRALKFKSRKLISAYPHLLAHLPFAYPIKHSTLKERFLEIMQLLSVFNLAWSDIGSTRKDLTVSDEEFVDREGMPLLFNIRVNTSWIPSFVFPFLKLISVEQDPSNQLVFEVIASLLSNSPLRSFFHQTFSVTSLSSPPLHTDTLAYTAHLIRHYDRTLADHLEEVGVGQGEWAGRLCSTLFSEVCSTTAQWGMVLDWLIFKVSESMWRETIKRERENQDRIQPTEEKGKKLNDGLKVKWHPLRSYDPRPDDEFIAVDWMACMCASFALLNSDKLMTCQSADTVDMIVNQHLNFPTNSSQDRSIDSQEDEDLPPQSDESAQKDRQKKQITVWMEKACEVEEKLPAEIKRGLFENTPKFKPIGLMEHREFEELRSPHSKEGMKVLSRMGDADEDDLDRYREMITPSLERGMTWSTMKGTTEFGVTDVQFGGSGLSHAGSLRPSGSSTRRSSTSLNDEGSGETTVWYEYEWRGLNDKFFESSVIRCANEREQAWKDGMKKKREEERYEKIKQREMEMGVKYELEATKKTMFEKRRDAIRKEREEIRDEERRDEMEEWRKRAEKRTNELVEINKKRESAYQTMVDMETEIAQEALDELMQTKRKLDGEAQEWEEQNKEIERMGQERERLLEFVIETAHKREDQLEIDRNKQWQADLKMKRKEAERREREKWQVLERAKMEQKKREQIRQAEEQRNKMLREAEKDRIRGSVWSWLVEGELAKNEAKSRLSEMEAVFAEESRIDNERMEAMVTEEKKQARSVIEFEHRRQMQLLSDESQALLDKQKHKLARHNQRQLDRLREERLLTKKKETEMELMKTGMALNQQATVEMERIEKMRDNAVAGDICLKEKEATLAQNRQTMANLITSERTRMKDINDTVSWLRMNSTEKKLPSENESRKDARTRRAFEDATRGASEGAVGDGRDLVFLRNNRADPLAAHD